MNMKKKLNFWLMALLVGGLSMAVTSCKDDDKDSGGGDDELVVGPTDTEEAENLRTHHWHSLARPAYGARRDSSRPRHGQEPLLRLGKH